MLRGIRKASSNWVGKSILTAVMSLLIASFAVWGIADIFRGFGRSTVAKIGNTEISTDQFRQLYTERLQLMSRQAGKPLTPEQARILGVDRQLMNQLLSEAALDERARELHLGISDAVIANVIMSNPTFKGLTGQFDRSRFELLLHNAGYTEARYVAEQRQTALRQQLVGSLTAGLGVPKAEAEAFNQYQNQTRSIAYVTLGPAQAGTIAPPAADVLAKYFEQRKSLFGAPEFRKVVVLSLTPADVAPKVKVTDEDAKLAYDEHKDRYKAPEKRHLQQIVFPTVEEAKAARERIAKGATFQQIAADRGLTDSQIDLGTVVKDRMLDRAVGEAAFKLPADGVSDPIVGQFGISLVHLVGIEPPTQRPFEEVKTEIKNELAAERAKTQLSDLRDKIEDARAGGSTLTEAAQKVGLTVRTIDAINRTGHDPKGAQVAGVPADLIGAAFNTDVGVDNEPLNVPAAGGYLWYEVTNIAPAHDRPLDEVKDQVEQAWRNDQIAEKLKALAITMVDAVKGGKPLAEVAQQNGLAVQTAAGFNRTTTPPGLSAAAVEAAFRTPKDGVVSAEGADLTQRFVLQVTLVWDPPHDPNAAQTKQFDQQLNRQLVSDLLTQYILRLEKDYGADVNQDALARVVGGQTN